jgi:hypothetical protein
MQSNIGFRSSVGKMTGGSTFQGLHKNWQEDIVKPWLDFLHLRHRKLCNWTR